MGTALKLNSGTLTCPDIPAFTGATSLEITYVASTNDWLDVKFFERQNLETFAFKGGASTGPFVVFAVGPLSVASGAIAPGRRELKFVYDGSTTSADVFVDGELLGTCEGLASSVPEMTEPTVLGDPAVTQNLVGEVYSFKVVADSVTLIDLDLTDLTPGQTSIEDSVGNTWTISGDAEIITAWGTGANYLRLDGSANTYASCPDIAAIGGATTLEIEVDLSLNSWATGVGQALVAQYGQLSGSRAFRFRTSTLTPSAAFDISSDGTNVDLQLFSDPLDVSEEERVTLRGELDVSGSVSFYLNDVLNRFNDSGSSIPSIADVSTNITVGGDSTTAGLLCVGDFYSCRIYADGVLVASPDFTNQPYGTTSFEDDQGNTWTLNGNAKIVDPIFGQGPNYVRVGGESTSNITTPEFSGLAGAESMTIELEVALASWSNSNPVIFTEWGQTAFSNFSFRYRTSTNPTTALVLSPDGTTLVNTFSEVYPFNNWQKAYLRVESIFDNGSDQTVISFYHSLDGKTWILNKTDTQPKIIDSLLDANTDVVLGAVIPSGVIDKFYAARIFADGVLIASPDFTYMEPGQTSVTDAQGNVWTLNGNAEVKSGGGNAGFLDDEYFFFFDGLV